MFGLFYKRQENAPWLRDVLDRLEALLPPAKGQHHSFQLSEKGDLMIRLPLEDGFVYTIVAIDLEAPSKMIAAQIYDRVNRKRNGGGE